MFKKVLDLSKFPWSFISEVTETEAGVSIIHKDTEPVIWERDEIL